MGQMKALPCACRAVPLHGIDCPSHRVKRGVNLMSFYAVWEAACIVGRRCCLEQALLMGCTRLYRFGPSSAGDKLNYRDFPAGQAPVRPEAVTLSLSGTRCDPQDLNLTSPSL